MKRLCLSVALLALALFCASPLIARTLGVITITTAVTAVTTAPLQFAKGAAPNAVNIQCRFTYGSGGTTAKAWVQTSLDGSNWTDVASCAFTTSSLRQVFNLSALTPVTTAYTATDGTLADNTVKDGIIGPQWRLKYTTTGTYAGSTVLAVDLNGAPLNN